MLEWVLKEEDGVRIWRVASIWDLKKWRERAEICRLDFEIVLKGFSLLKMEEKIWVWVCGVLHARLFYVRGMDQREGCGVEMASLLVFLGLQRKGWGRWNGDEERSGLTEERK